MAKRIQRQRTRGWRKPPNTVVVTRGTFWGNPFVVRPDLEPGTKISHQYIAVPTAEDAVAVFREWLERRPEIADKARRNLGGKDLACWCGLDDEPCHADVLLEVANGGAADVSRPSSDGGELSVTEASGGPATSSVSLSSPIGEAKTP